MKKTMLKASSIILSILTIIAIFPASTVKAAEANPFHNKTISILGDSLSTYENVSSGDAASTTNSTILNNKVYYTDNRTNVTLNDTWWMQAANTLGAKILVNNSYSNSTIFSPTTTDTSLGYYTRPNNLHDNTGSNSGEQPDIIAVFMGTNDVSYNKYSVGTFDAISFNTLYTLKNGVYTYKKPTTTCEAYAIMIHKIITKYKGSEVYCFNLFPRYFDSSEDSKIYNDLNQAIVSIAKKYNCKLVDVTSSLGNTIDKTKINRYLSDGFVHPNKQGMDIITSAFLSSLYENSKYTANSKVYNISYNTSNVLFKTGRQTKAIENSTFDCTLLPLNHGNLKINVKMNNVDITSTAYSNGKIHIEKVTGNISITASVTSSNRVFKSYRFINHENELINIIDNENHTNELKHSDNVATFTSNIKLNYDTGWSVIFRTDAKSKNELTFLSSSSCNYSLVINKSKEIIGFKNQSTNEVWGTSFSQVGLRTNDVNTFKITNSYNSILGANTFTLYIDSKKVGVFDTLYSNYEKIGSFCDGINELDLVFNTIATSVNTEYVQFWENSPSENHIHKFDYPVSTAPTCEDAGKIISTCDCGAVSTQITQPASGHKTGDWLTDKPATTFENGELYKVCNVCNEIVESKADPQLKCDAPVISSLSNTEDGIKVTWNYVDGADSYRVYHRTVNGSWKYIATTSSNYYFDNSVKGGYWYNYTVRAVNEAGYSSYDTSGKSIQALATPDFTSILNAHNGIRLNWNKVYGATGYYLYRKAGNGNWQYYAKVTTNAYTDTSVSNGVTYQYRLKAFRNSTISGYHYAPISIKRFTSPLIKSATNTDSGIKIQWNTLSGAKGYYVYRKLGSGGWKYIGHSYGTAFTDKNASAGYTYTYTVKAYDSLGNSSSYNTVGLTCKRLSTPKLYDTDIVSGGIKVKWYAVTGASGYNVYRKTSNGSWQLIGKTTGKTYTDKTAKKGVSYTYTVKAYSNSYTSSYNANGITAKR